MNVWERLRKGTERAALANEAETLYLMDGSAFIFRGFYANQSLQRSDGMPTGALHIVTRILLRLLREERPKHFAFVLDGHGPTFRHALFPLYKAQRGIAPEGLVQQIEPVRRLVAALGLKLVVSSGCEADDCLASLAARHREAVPVVLVGADKDLKQCLAPNVILWDPASRDEKITTLESFMAESGVTPAQWPDVQAVIGDSSDNIPGVPGVGPKTAAKIFVDFPNLESIRDRFDELPPALKKKFDGQVDAAFLYRQLTTLRTSECQDLTLDDLRIQPFDPREAAGLLREFELSSLERELSSLMRSGRLTAKGTAPDTVPGTPGQACAQGSLLETPRSEAATEAIRREICPDLASLRQAIGQGTGEIPGEGKIAVLPLPDGLALAAQGQKAEALYTGSPAALAEALGQVLTKSEKAILVTADLKALLRAGEDRAWSALPADRWLDLGLASYLLDPEERDYAWPRLAGHWSAALDLPVDNPALLALAVAEQVDRRLAGAALWPLMRELELPLVPVLASMEEAGVMLDAAALEAYLREAQEELDRLQAQIFEQAGGEFNIRSAQQIGEVLFQRLQLPTRRKTKGGQAATSQDVLEGLSGAHPVVDALLAFRKLEKIRSTYLEPLPRLMDADGRIRTTFNQWATATGRLSSSRPNLQNIPVRGERGQRMRACFTAPAGSRLVSADYSQIELRVLAHLSGDATLLAAFREGADIHARTAALLFNVDPGAVTPDQRRSAKTINFGLIYGMGPQKLARELSIPLAEARAFIQRYFEHLDGVGRFYEDVEASARREGLVTTLAGRRRLLPGLHAEEAQARALAKRQAFNTLIQGSAADVIKLAMIAVFNDEDLRRFKARLVLQIHDELLLEVPEEHAEDAARRVAAIMAAVQPGGQSLRVPLVADWGVGRNWGEAH